MALTLFVLPGCAGPGGHLSVRSQAGPPRSLVSRFDSAVFRHDRDDKLTVVLFDGPAEDPRQAVTLRVFWHPRAGRTPIDRTATNATIHYLIFSGDDDGQAGIYSGAGFVFPDLSGDRRKLSAAVWEANLRLHDASAGFEDLLGQALLEGRFTARRDDAAVSEALHRLHVLASQRLGYPRLVHAAEEGE